MDSLHKKDHKLMGHLVGNDVDTMYEERKHLVGFSFVRVYRYISLFIDVNYFI
jgi:hypothetical protein